MKHRTEGNATGTSIKVGDMYALPSVSAATAKAAKHLPMVGSAEKRTFTLTGFLWQAKVEGNDPPGCAGELVVSHCRRRELTMHVGSSFGHRPKRGSCGEPPLDTLGRKRVRRVLRSDL